MLQRRPLPSCPSGRHSRHSTRVASRATQRFAHLTRFVHQRLVVPIVLLAEVGEHVLYSRHVTSRETVPSASLPFISVIDPTR